MFPAACRIQFRSAVRLLTLFCVVACLCAAHALAAQAYTSIVVFGDSLSDTGNDAALSRAKYTFSAQVPGPASGYTDGRFTNGTDTVPAARNYNGVWIEQLAARLAAKPVIRASLAGGTDYAYGFATTNAGTSNFTYGPGNALNFQVNNLGQQVSDYLATGPTVNSSTLFVVWGGANDLLAATSAADIQAAAGREVALVQRLIAAGATDILIPNLPPLGLVPRLNGSASTSAAATAGAQAFNAVLALGLSQLPAANPGKTLRLYSLDIFTLFNTVVTAPAASGLANVTASSQGNATVNPDTYLFWDDLHPTTYGHSLIASAAFRALGTPAATTTALTASASSVNLGSSVTLTATVSSAGGTPQGTVSFLDGATAIGSSVVTATGSSAIATLATSALMAGTHTITANFSGVNGFSSSSASATTVTVVPPTFSAVLGSSSLSVARGSSGTTTLTITPAGGYTGNFTIACGSVSRVSCFVTSSTATLSGTGSVTTFVTVDTKNTVSRAEPASSSGALSRVVSACLLLPVVAGVSLGRRRRSMLRQAGLFTVALLLSCGMVLGLTGCGSSHDTPSGTYTVPVVVTPASGSAVTLNLSVSVQ